MGVLGFAAAYALMHAGVARSTATNASLLIIVEPVTLLLLGPLLLGERLARREVAGSVAAVAGAVLVVVNGIPGITDSAPHWRGDLLLVLSGLAFAAYSLLGRTVLPRHPLLPVTLGSLLWGIVALLPLAAVEWLGGHRPVWTSAAVSGTLYLALVVTGPGFLFWNYALARVQAARAAVFLTVQPVVGTLLGVTFLGEPVTPFVVAGGALIIAGLCLTVPRPFVPR